jgi:hypothetical protein
VVMTEAQARAIALRENPHGIDKLWWEHGFWWAVPLDVEGLTAADRPDNTSTLIRIQSQTSDVNWIDFFEGRETH